MSFGPKFPEILVEWIAHNVSNIIFFTQYPLTPSREEVLRIYKMVNKGKMLQSLLIMYVDNGLQGLTAFIFLTVHNAKKFLSLQLSQTSQAISAEFNHMLRTQTLARKRKKVISEIFATEKTYQEHLHAITSVSMIIIQQFFKISDSYIIIS